MSAAPSLKQFEALMAADPERAQALLEGLLAKKFIPHEGQRPVMESAARFKTMCAGRRFGKTKIAAALAMRKCRQPRMMVWWVAPTYKIVKRGYNEVLRQLPKETLTKPAPPDTSFDSGRSVVLSFKNGSKMEFYSAERAEGMLGEGVDLAILDEAAIMPEHVWFQIVRPTLADRQGEALFISTPRGRNWFHKMYLMGQDDLVPAYDSWRFPSMTNPYIPAEEWEDLEQTLPAAVYEQEVMADFVSNAASVFRIPESGIVPIERPKGHVTFGIDLAKYNDFTVITGVNSGNRHVCHHERFNSVSWPEQRRRVRAAIEKVEANGADSVTVMLDSTGIGDVVYDDLSLEGLDAIPVKFTNQWKQQAVMLLAADLERGNAFIIDKQLSELESYAYEITDAGRWKFEAASGHDDEVSAALLAHWGIVNEGVPDVHMLTTSGVGDDDLGGSAGEPEDEVDDWSGHYHDAAEDEPETKIIEPLSHQELLVRGVW